MRFATLISQWTEPMIVFMGLALLGGWQSGLRDAVFFFYVIYLLVISIIIWFVRLRLTRSLHTNWDVSDRPKRVRLLVLLLGFSILFFSSLVFFGSASLMKVSGMYFLWLLGFSLITLKTKISGHMAVSTLAVGWFWPIALALPFIGWSRLVLKRHTVREVIGGFLYSFVFLLFL